MHTVAAADDEYFICPRCDKVFTEVTPFKGFKLEDDDGVDNAILSGRPRTKTKGKNGVGRDVLGFEPNSPPSTWLAMSDHDPDIKLVPSTKVTILKSMLLKIFDEAPMDKVCHKYDVLDAPITDHLSSL